MHRPSQTVAKISIFKDLKNKYIDNIININYTDQQEMIKNIDLKELLIQAA